MVSAAQKRAQDRAKGITTYNKATGTTQPSTTGGGSTPSTTSTPSTQTNNSNFWAGAADYAGGTPTQNNTNPATFSPNQATGNYQAPTNYQNNPNIPGQAQTDFSQTNTNKINPNQFKYGQAAITGGVNQQDRNLQLGSYYAGIGAKSYQDIYNDLSKIQSYASMDEAAKQRTAQDIYQKMGQYVTPEMTPEEKMMANLKKELGRAQTRGETEISDFMRTVFANQQTIDKGIEKFSNWNDINRKVQGVAEAVARNKMLNAGKGEVTTAQLTESDIQAAMQATGATREEVIAIANGKGYEGLQRSDKYKSEYLTKDYDRWVEDINTQKQRNLEDLKTNLDQTRQNIGRQIQDIVEQVKQNVAAAEKIGALKGFNRSSGYLDGIVSVQAEGNKLVDRLQTQLMNAENADEESRSRLLEDFNRNLSRAKFDMDQQLNDLKNTTAVELGQLQAKYSIGSPEMALALNDLQERAINFSNTAYNNYTVALRGNIAAKQEELDYITNQENKRLNQINTLQTVMSANNGAAVMNMSMNTLKEYAKQGMKTDQVSAFRSAMINKTIASFSGLTSADKENVTRMIDQGQTPAQVIQQLQSQGKTYIGTAGTEFQNVYINGKQQTLMQDANGNRIPVNVPERGSQITPSGNIISIKLNNKNVGLDMVAAPSIQNAFTQMQSQGIGDIVIGQGHRDQVATIKTMAAKYGIPFNAENPAETAKALTAAGHKVAVPGGSKHETGMAIDLYGKDGKAPSDEQTAILNKNGRYQTAGAGDMGHFEYLGSKGGKGGEGFDNIFELVSFDKPTLAEQEKVNFDKLVASGDTAEVKSKLIKLAVNNIEGADAKKDYQETQTMIGSLEKIKDTLDKLKAKGVDTGYFKGKYNDLLNKFGKVGDPEITKLATTLRDQLDALRRGRSGAALTEFEESFYDSIFPGAGKRYDLNISNVEGLLNSRNIQFSTYLENAYTPEIANQIMGIGTTTTDTQGLGTTISSYKSRK